MTQPGNALAVPGNSEYGDGLEDIDRSDLTIPRLKIDHKAGVLKDGQTGQEFGEIFAIMLGLVKQRILWHPKIESDERPMCKSADFNVGWPNLQPAKPEKAFPWQKAGFDPRSFTPNENGLVQLPCEGCALKDWGSHPMGDKPYCAEQHTLPLLYAQSVAELMETGGSPALFTVQKSGIKPSRNYLSPFAQRRIPVYSAVTKIGLRVLSQGTNPYAVPIFTTVQQTEQADWPDFSERYHSMRAFLQGNTPRGAAAEDAQATVPQSAPAPAPAAQAAPPPAAPVAQPAAQPAPAAPVATPAPTVVSDADDDLPF